MGVTLTNYEGCVIVTTFNRDHKEYVSTIINANGDYDEYANGHVFRAYDKSFETCVNIAKRVIDNLVW